MLAAASRTTAARPPTTTPTKNEDIFYPDTMIATPEGEKTVETLAIGDLPAIVEMDLPHAKSQRQVPSATRQRLAARAVELGYSAVTAAVA